MIYRDYECIISLKDDICVIKNISPSIFYFYDKDISRAIEYWKQEIDYILRNKCQ